MKTRKGTYTAPLNAVYRMGKRKEQLTKAINLLKSVKSDAEESMDSFALCLASNLSTVIEDLETYRKMLES